MICLYLNKDVIIVKPEPNEIDYYEFVSKHPPTEVSLIKKNKVYCIEDISKNNKNVWREYPYIISFIEKLNCDSFNIWEMMPVFHE